LLLALLNIPPLSCGKKDSGAFWSEPEFFCLLMSC
jgi:hypothetical protein